MLRVRRLDRREPIHAKLIPRAGPRAEDRPWRIGDERGKGKPVDEAELLEVGVGDEQERIQIGRRQIFRPREARMERADMLVEERRLVGVLEVLLRVEVEDRPARDDGPFATLSARPRSLETHGSDEGSAKDEASKLSRLPRPMSAPV